jgi:hypothetical protein
MNAITPFPRRRVYLSAPHTYADHEAAQQRASQRHAALCLLVDRMESALGAAHLRLQRGHQTDETPDVLDLLSQGADEALEKVGRLISDLEAVT